MPTRSELNPAWADLAPYAGQWATTLRRRMTGVSWTAEQAPRAAARSQFKEGSKQILVPAVEAPDGDRSAA